MIFSPPFIIAEQALNAPEFPFAIKAFTQGLVTMRRSIAKKVPPILARSALDEAVAEAYSWDDD